MTCKRLKFRLVSRRSKTRTAAARWRRRPRCTATSAVRCSARALSPYTSLSVWTNGGWETRSCRHTRGAPSPSSRSLVSCTCCFLLCFLHSHFYSFLPTIFLSFFLPFFSAVYVLIYFFRVICSCLYSFHSSFLVIYSLSAVFSFSLYFTYFLFFLSPLSAITSYISSFLRPYPFIPFSSLFISSIL